MSANEESQGRISQFKYVATGLIGTYDTRHEAIGDLAKYGDWESGEITPITENCLVRAVPELPEHLGNKYYGDRSYLATSHGATRIDLEALVRTWNGANQETVESHWIIDCPVCYRTHKSDEGTEQARAELIDEVLDCCGVEWFPPSDWVESCEICGGDHRGECSNPKSSAGRVDA